MILFSTADWANVIVAFVVGIPGLVSSVLAFHIHQKIRTPSGTPIGAQVENALHTGLANNYRLRAVSDAVKAPELPGSTTEAAKVPDLPESHEPGG